MKKRISWKEWEYIGKYNPAAKWVRPLCSYSLIKVDEDHFRRECRIGWIMYLILFLPVHLIQLFYSLWDGGLKEFEFQRRFIYADNITRYGDSYRSYPYAEEVWKS